MEEELEKIAVPLLDDWHGFSVETLWGREIDTNTYRIDNIPFFARGISLDDIVEVKLDEHGRRKVYQKVISKSGNCTYRFLFTDSVLPNQRDEYLDLLHNYGDTEYYQGKDLYAMSVPKDKAQELYKILNKFEKDKILDFEEGDCVV